jgi:hypothetical protein
MGPSAPADTTDKKTRKLLLGVAVETQRPQRREMGKEKPRPESGRGSWLKIVTTD